MSWLRPGHEKGALDEAPARHLTSRPLHTPSSPPGAPSPFPRTLTGPSEPNAGRNPCLLQEALLNCPSRV